jgi:hypothetical protein
MSAPSTRRGLLGARAALTRIASEVNVSAAAKSALPVSSGQNDGCGDLRGHRIPGPMPPLDRLRQRRRKRPQLGRVPRHVPPGT